MTVDELLVAYIRAKMPSQSLTTVACNEAARLACKRANIDRVLVGRLTGQDTLKLPGRHWIMVRRMFDWAVKEGLAKSNPLRTVDCPPATKGKRRNASIELYRKTPEERFEALMGRNTPPTGQSVTLDRARLIARFVLATGCRRGEVCALRLDDVDWVNKTVRITKAVVYHGNGTAEKAPKTKAGDRLIALPDEIMAELKTLRDNSVGKKYLFESRFGNRIHPINLSTDVKRYLEQVGLGEFSLHTLRHVHASKLVEAGLAINVVAARLGHSDPAITTRVYVHPTQKQDREAAAAIGSLL